MSAAPLRPVEALREHHRIHEFASAAEVLDRWLRQSARTAAAAGTAATYVLCRGDRVVGYYALAMSSVVYGGAPARLRRGMPDLCRSSSWRGLRIDRTERGTGLGGDLLIDALRRCVRGAREFGAHAVVVDPIDGYAAGFYRHFGFLELEGQRLWRRIADIERALAG